MTLYTGMVDVTVISGRTRFCTTYTVLVHVVFINKIIRIFAKSIKIYKYVLFYFTLHNYMDKCTKIGRSAERRQTNHYSYLST